MLLTMSKNGNSRNKEIDILKTLAVFMVVWGHVLYNVAGITSGYISYVHMPVFYFASGLFIGKELSKYNLGEFAWKKTLRLFIPYVIWSAISFAANALLIIATFKTIPKSQLINEAYNIFINSRSVWFLIQLFIAELLFALIYMLGRYNVYLLIALNTVIWALLVMFCRTEYFMMWKIKWLYPFLVIGYLFGNGNIPKFKLGKFIPSAICAGLWGYMTYLYAGLYTKDGLFYGFDLGYLDKNILVKELFLVILGFLGIMAIYLLARILGHTPLAKPLADIGNYTLDIYLIHMMLIFVMKKLPYKQEGFAFISAGYTLGICLTIYIVAKYLLRKIKLYRISIGTK
ncbi:acyltransferase family protein [Butyrivibrio proteoclasticus]|uniref:acyltransferase family protein n=1 Tax=Butyrivibrio proteoclasticus TaxID=43305 RepID=UPI000479F3D6|nr:acyltransferase [Butyrivibrio proteoclasticus]